MYCSHFQLDRQPFKITPDTSLFYTGGQRGAALEALVYAIQRGEGITKVVGEVGSGKTMLCRMLALKFPDKVEFVYLNNPRISAQLLPHLVAMELNLPVDNSQSRVEVIQRLQLYLIEQHKIGKQVVILAEEAQSMPLDTLEEIRLLTNLETEQNKLIQIVLFGQPELDQLLDRTEIRQLKDRITFNLYLKPFDTHDIQHYLNFRMTLAGYRGDNLFTRSVARLIFRHSSGLLRRINIIADKALLSSFSRGKDRIAGKDVINAALDSDLHKPYSKSALVISFLVSAVLLGAGLANAAMDSGSSTYLISHPLIHQEK